MDVTTMHYLNTIRQDQNGEKAIVARKQIENDISLYRVTALKLHPRATGYLCHVYANMLEHQLKEALSAGKEI